VNSDQLPQAADGYGWATIPEALHELPVHVLDLDGTLRGDVAPMVKLARPLVPNYLNKLTFHEPWNTYKLFHFAWSLGMLWTLRTIHREQRRRYKHLFSELHHLAATLLRDTPIEKVRDIYRRRIPHMHKLWFDGAVEFLGQATQRGTVVVVTGSEQIQTEQCVQLLAGRGVDLSRVFVRGSRYAFDPRRQWFTGGVAHLNVTLDAKRDAVLPLLDQHRIVLAAGNSRPDRALFEAVDPSGICVLVCARSVVANRNSSTFVIRKLHRSGFRIFWEPALYLRALADFQADPQPAARPVLATDQTFRGVLDSAPLRAHLQQLAISPVAAGTPTLG